MVLPLSGAMLVLSAAAASPQLQPGSTAMAYARPHGSPGAAQERPVELPSPDAWTALERGDASKAAAIFREALDRSPTNPALHFGAGYAAYALGRLDAAISSLKKALQYEPRFVQAAALLAQVAYERGELELAIRSMEKAVALAPYDRLRADQLDRWRRESSVHDTLEERADLRFRILFEGHGPAADCGSSLAGARRRLLERREGPEQLSQ
jgi:tetratricopeptide (TPR) repeat protein